MFDIVYFSNFITKLFSCETLEDAWKQIKEHQNNDPKNIDLRLLKDSLQLESRKVSKQRNNNIVNDPTDPIIVSSDLSSKE